MIAPSVILPYDSTHASIPSGYTRETSLDSKYIKGTADATNPNTTGGAATHTHTSTAPHSHTLPSHTHTGTSGPVTNAYGGWSTSGSGTNRTNHTHTFTTGGSSGGTTNTSSPTYGSVSNDPPYYTVIFIKSTGYSTIPNNAMVFSASTTRTDFDFHTASANKFLKGAGTGANAGSTGGSTTNIHSLSHTHGVNTHSHSNSTTATGNNPLTASSGHENSPVHTHTAYTANKSAPINTYSGSLTTTETVEPAYRTLNAFKNTSGSSVAPVAGDIALWLGTLATIPVGWKLCDGSDGTPDMRGRYYKNPSSASASATGGSNTHTHAAQGHTHTSGTHYHTVTFSTYSSLTVSKNNKSDDGTLAHSLSGHTHDSVNSNTSSQSYASANTSANSASNEPEYRTVAFIQFEYAPVIPNPIIGMLIDKL